ncbi:hypothetical protein QJ856_gp0892 [Tupanvirus deep ocean]|uniref:Uncharacterized protein n=2 Tax=Tupanvirus TaxID=2094720 RepID=A0AC62A7V5_9VIRU|nr:hypothetical protein QJ856_gp0892 [Tupanvirus deep ocean]QKU33865.1 hypothetical protein [Tupanvirus deep ocean]
MESVGGLDMKYYFSKDNISVHDFFDLELGLAIDNINDIDQFFSKKVNLFDYEFFSLINETSINVSVLGEIMAPFYFAVYNWCQHLEKLQDKMLENNAARYCIELLLENINDEKGIVNQIQNIDKCHVTTYINFLHALGYHDKLQSTKAVNDFNEDLEYCLNNKSIAYNAALLAGIEYLYIDISSIISKYCKINSIEQDHYELHEILDYKHASDLFMISKKCGASTEELVYGMAKGYIMILSIFDNLYKETMDMHMDRADNAWQDLKKTNHTAKKH